MFLSSSHFILPVPFQKMKLYGEDKMQIWRWNRNGTNVFRSVKEINAHTIEFKKRWHIYCNINVIYIVFFCWKRQKIQIPVAMLQFFFLCASTIPFIWHKNNSFITPQWTLKSKMEIALSKNLELVRSLFKELEYEQQFSCEMPYVNFL